MTRLAAYPGLGGSSEKMLGVLRTTRFQEPAAAPPQ
jgi:hypothetical protein